MSIECKVCKSEKRDYIEQLILQGNSNLAVSITLKDMNEDISHASINRHKTKHMADYAETIKEAAHEKGNRKYDRDDSKNSFVINANKIYEDMESSIMHNFNYNELAKNYSLMLLMLNRIVNNQLAITIDLQEKYMKGESKYPNEQIRGLQIVQEIMLKLETYTRQNFQHYDKIVNSELGICMHVRALGENAKKELALKKPYIKGTIFKYIYDGKCIEDYYEDYHPVNTYSEFYRNCIRYDLPFENGIKAGYSIIEKQDMNLYNLLKEECIDTNLYEELLKKYSEEDYDVIIEIKNLEKIKYYSVLKNG